MFSTGKYLIIIDAVATDKKLDEYFAKFHFNIVQYSDPEQLKAGQQQPEAILINASLVQKDLSIIKSLYQHHPVPLLVVSDVENEELCVSVLEAGADDFLTKPVHPRELHARIGAISRRVQRSIKEGEQGKEVLKFASLRLLPSSRQVLCSDDRELQLTAGEYDLLLAFVRQPQQILSREFLLQVSGHMELGCMDRRIDVQISRLRQKIEARDGKSALIKTIRNSGYLFTVDVVTE